MIRQFMEVLDTNDAVFFITIVVLIAIVAIVKLYVWLLSDARMDYKCGHCHVAVNYLTVGGICQGCAEKEMAVKALKESTGT